MQDTSMNFTCFEKKLNAQNHLHINYEHLVQEPIYLHNTIITIISYAFFPNIIFSRSLQTLIVLLAKLEQTFFSHI
jgi:hypothetical protein